jgi:predicted peptidase
MKKRRFLIPLLALSMLSIGTLVGCGGNNDNPTDNPDNPDKPDTPDNPDTPDTPDEKPQIVITAEKTKIYVNETLQLQANVEGVTWSSRDDSIATVSETGLVTALKQGEVIILARKTDYKVGQFTLTIEKAPAREDQLAVLEFEFADHYSPSGSWGYPQWGMVPSHDGDGSSPLEDVESASGGISVGYFNQGCKETLYFTSDKAGNLDFGIDVAYNAEVDLSTTLKITVNGVEINMAGKVCEGPETEGSYTDWHTTMLGSAAVKTGEENVIVVECIGSQGVNLDCMRVYGTGYTIAQRKVTPKEKLVYDNTPITIELGKTAQLNVTTEGVTYTSENTEVATVSATGLVTAKAAGVTNILITKEGFKDGQVQVRVTEPAPVSDHVYTLEFEDAEHYSPSGSWGYPQWGMVPSHDGDGSSPIEDVESASGGMSLGYLQQGCKETFTFTCNKAQTVILDMVAAHNKSMTIANNIKLTVNGKEVSLAGIVLEGTGYTAWKDVFIKDVALKEGTNTIEFEGIGQMPNLDCLKIMSNEELVIEMKKPAAPVAFGKLDYYVEGYEWGPAITGVKLKLNGSVNKAILDKENFVVKTKGTAREILDVYFVNDKDEKVTADTGTVIRFDLKVSVTSNQWGGTNDNGSNPFTYANNVNNWTQGLKCEVKLAAGKSMTVGEQTFDDEHPGIANEVEGRVVLSTKNWGEQKSNTLGDVTLTYKAYETDTLKNDGVKNPLIIWLHGQGEGGTDVDIALLGNDVTNLGESKVQNHFVKGSQKGAYVLAVQTPTAWMNNGPDGTNGGGHSIYRAALKDTIDKYIAANPDVDASKLILGGCSNGGYMTMEMAINYPTFFKAYYPVCEAYQDSLITDENIQTLKGLSIWFTHSADDTTVRPDNFTVATYKRLMAAGATDVHFSYFVDVRGSEGGQENKYMGHYSWIYTLKDECVLDQADPENVSAPSTKAVKVGDEEVTLWGWAASK